MSYSLHNSFGNQPTVTGFNSTPLRNYAKADFEGMSNYLLQWPYSTVPDVEKQWSSIKSAIMSAIVRFVPVIHLSKKHGNQPAWFNSKIRHKVNCLSTLKRRYKRKPSSSLGSKIDEKQTSLSLQLEQAKSNYVCNIVNSSSVQPASGKLFSYIQSLAKSDSSLPQKMVLDNAQP